MNAPRSAEEIAALDLATPFELMKFTLTYDGFLPSCGNRNPRLKEKWDIRRKLHPQLAELWQADPVLAKVARHSKLPKAGGLASFEQHHSFPEYQPADQNFSYIDICRKEMTFIPLVRDSLALICGVNILFLRKEDPGALIKQGGDLDNRIKTLFDALRLPEEGDEMQCCKEDDPQPFYCLLESDSLISNFSVDSDRLLTSSNSNANEARLVVTVPLKLHKFAATTFC